MTAQTQLTFEEWKEKYRPIPNSLLDNAYEGLMFETYGVDLTTVNAYLNDGDKRLQIWTLCDEDGVTWITNGYHYVNRQGYFLTEVPFEDGQLIEIMIDDGSDRDDDEENDDVTSSVDG